MAPERSPAFQLYPKDFLTDAHVMAMTLAELGVYTILLFTCWLEQSLPTDLPTLARICKVSPKQFSKLWPAVKPCFIVKNGRLIQKRLELERQKQEAFRETKAAAGSKGGLATARAKQKGSSAAVCLDSADSKRAAKHSSSSPISYLHTPVEEQVPPPRGQTGTSVDNPTPDGRSKRPIFSGQRITIFEWQLDDCAKTLGAYLNAFDIHEWFFALDAAAVRDGLVVPKRDGGAWLQAELVKEAQKRGLPLKFASVDAERDAVMAWKPSKRPYEA